MLRQEGLCPVYALYSALESAIDDAPVDGDGEAITVAAPARPIADPLAGLLRTGLDLLTQLASAEGPGQGAASAPSRMFERIRDEGTGQSYLKIRIPQPEVMDRVAGALQAHRRIVSAANVLWKRMFTGREVIR
jgi:hypothetical protein